MHSLWDNQLERRWLGRWRRHKCLRMTLKERTLLIWNGNEADGGFEIDIGMLEKLSDANWKREANSWFNGRSHPAVQCAIQANYCWYHQQLWPISKRWKDVFLSTNQMITFNLIQNYAKQNRIDVFMLSHNYGLPLWINLQITWEWWRVIWCQWFNNDWNRYGNSLMFDNSSNEMLKKFLEINEENRCSWNGWRFDSIRTKHEWLG